MTINDELMFNDWLNSLQLSDVAHEMFRGKHHRALLRAQEQRRRAYYGDTQPRLVPLTVDEVNQEFLAKQAGDRSRQRSADRRRKNG